MSRSRVPVYLGVAAVGGVGYYLYAAGGNPKVAEKKFEADAHKASAKLRSEMPGRGKEAEAKANELGSRAGAKFDSYVEEGKSKLSEAEARAERYKQEAGTKLNRAIDKADRKVEEGAAKAKSGVSGWFGGK